MQQIKMNFIILANDSFSFSFFAHRLSLLWLVDRLFAIVNEQWWLDFYCAVEADKVQMGAAWSLWRLLCKRTNKEVVLISDDWLSAAVEV